MSASPPLLRVRGLVKTWPNGLTALRGVDLDVEEGEFVVVLGRSGAGKSTLLRCIDRLIEPTGGSVLFGGQEVTSLRGRALRALRSDIAFVFQHFNLVRRATALTNVLTGSLEREGPLAGLLGLWPRATREEAWENLRRVGLEDLAWHRADTLSGGQQQRVAIARALQQRPRLVLADEPVASLDPATSHAVLRHLQRLREEEGITVVANLHFLSLAREYATRVVALRDGEKVWEGRPDAIDDARFAAIYGEDATAVELR